MYDIAIIGAGPAGFSAGITARAHNKHTVIISNKPQDNPLAKSTLVENYPGMPSTSGLNLLTTMAKQTQTLGCEFMHARVIAILPVTENKTTRFAITAGNDYIEAKSLILAVGAGVASKLFEGELEFLGRGVSYCAVCDGMLFRNSTVCVVGLSAEAFGEARLLAELGATVYYLVPKQTKDFKAPDFKIPANMYIREAVVRAIEGDALGITGVRIREKADGHNKESVISCQGVFVLRPSIAPVSLLASLDLENGGLIKTDKRMHTNVSGVFAAGDCTGKPFQIAKAVGEGQIACFSAVEYLDACYEK